MSDKRLPLETRIGCLEAARVIVREALRRADDETARNARVLIDQGLVETIDYLTRSIPVAREIGAILRRTEGTSE